ncbi:hypothetical protein [Kitasatospora sp. NPDC056731]|uniref:hypothetical protein n=1 Tax=Kitasatospora sp. NPDC056731 TaxID=3155422 RepID=UPI0034135EEB
MRNPLSARASAFVAASALVCSVFTSAGAAPAVPAAVPAGRALAAQVAFWAGQSVQPCLAVDPLTCPRDLSAFTDTVWNTLAAGHSPLYLDLVYGSDFGPALPGENQRTDALALVEQANTRGVPVSAWITVPLSDGTFDTEQNAALVQSAVEDFHVWSLAHDLQFSQAVLDLESPTGDQAVAQALTQKDLTGFNALLNANSLDPAAQCRAIHTYADTIAWAHQNGMRISGSPVPYALDDLDNGSIALQAALGITAFPPTGYDQYFLQAYRAFGIDLGSGYVASYFADIQRYFGTAGQVTIGNTGIPPYDNLTTVVNDIRMLTGLGATTIPVFDLEGTVKAFGADGVTALVQAGRNPMTGSELTAATQMSVTGAAARALFHTLDTAATTATPLTTGHQPNPYPGACM